MRGEKLTDAILYDKLNLLQKDFFGYIERNIGKVDENLPVFYGYAISALETSFPTLADDVYDEFIDGITFKVLDASSNIRDPEYIRRVMASAIRSKKRKDADVGINIVVGLKLIKSGDCVHALEHLEKYSELDAKLGTAVAHCFYVLSLREFKEKETSEPFQRPGEMELRAREKMVTLARLQPPLNRFRHLEPEDTSFLDQIFWQMIFFGLEWFPSERWFLEVGLKNADLTGDGEMKKRLLDMGAELFFSDKLVLREMFNYKLKARDAGGAAGIVSQLLREYPNDPEPIYLGLKLSLLTTKKITYLGFRRLASVRGIPGTVLDLFDIAFDLMTNEKKDALRRIADFEAEFPKYRYYATILRYIAHDFFAGDELRVKRAKKSLLDSVEQFAIEELGIGT